MDLLQFLRFGPGDSLEFLLAGLLLVLAVVWRPFLESPARKLAERTVLCMALLAVLPVALRLLLLPHHPVPTPDVYDEFSHLLVADTLRHFRLANPPHAMHAFFETFFVLQEPTYSSIYPLGQGIPLAIGWVLCGVPWAGVLFSTAALCSLAYWMLRAWTTPGWALAGGVLAVIEFGPLCQWMNCYWGGAFAAAAGCLVFGSLPRIRDSGRVGAGVALGAGLGLHLLTRPFESIFLAASVVLFFTPDLRRPEVWRKLARPALAAALVVLPAVGLTLLQNRRVTGSWTTLPEALSQYQYGVPAGLTFQANPLPHRELTREQALDYRMQSGFRTAGPETGGSYFQRLEYRVRYYRFFFLPPLYIALAVFLVAMREFRIAWAVATLAIFALGVNFFPAFQLHYVAAVTCLFLLASVGGLERLSRLAIGDGRAGPQVARLLMFLCIAHFALWYGVHATEAHDALAALRPYETWDAINHQNPERRILVNQELAELPGKLLVLVRYDPQHVFQEEWVYNAADIDGARIVWARDLGAEENARLLRYYSGRTVLLLEPDARPPRLGPYQP